MPIYKPAIMGISIAVVQDATLSYAALGLYVFMMSHPAEDFHKRNLFRAGTGMKGMQNLIKELEDHNLLISEINHDHEE